MRTMHIGVAFLFFFGGVSPAFAGVEDPGMVPVPQAFEVHRRAGDESYALQQYEAALREYKAAYAIQQTPELLYNLGRTARKLGQAGAALDYFDRYLVNEPDPPTPRGLDLQRQAREIRKQLALAAADRGIAQAAVE